MKAARVLVVDDSIFVRDAARRLLSAQPDMHVCGLACDPVQARELIARDGWPDVMVLDMQMPRQDGLSFLRELMREHPLPVVVCSSLVANGARLGIEALAAGALSLVCKPRGDHPFCFDEGEDLVSAVRAAAHSRRAHLGLHRADQAVAAGSAPALSDRRASSRVIALGASTGGTQALDVVLRGLPADLPGIVIVQHMPKGFSVGFAEQLNRNTRIEVRQARDGEPLRCGEALIAEAGKQMRLLQDGGGLRVEVRDGPLINRHRPSVDCLFGSVAKAAGVRAIGVLMTGMGDDGALGLRQMAEAGALTVAESEESCVVFGMPRVAIEIGAAREVLALEKIAARIQSWAAGVRAGAAALSA